MKRQLIIVSSCLLLLAILFLTTDPSHLPSLFLIAPFLIIFLIIFLLVWIFARTRMLHSKAMRVSALCAGTPVLLLVLQSIGQLTFRDVFTLAALFGIAYFYISKTSLKA
jgi:hypothetical protein